MKQKVCGSVGRRGGGNEGEGGVVVVGIGEGDFGASGRGGRTGVFAPFGPYGGLAWW